MSKFVVVDSPALAEQMDAAGHEAVSVPANVSFGLVMGRITSLGDPAQVSLVCTPERTDLALTALPYVGLSVVVGAEATGTNDGVLRVPTQDAASVLAAVQQYSAWQPEQQPHAAQQAPPPDAQAPPPFPYAPPPDAQAPPPQQDAGPGSGTVGHDAPQAMPSFAPAPPAAYDTGGPQYGEPVEQTTSAEPSEKAQFFTTTYDPAFKSAPWASQVTDTNSPHGLIIAVTAAKGGAGKSTLACWLSEALMACGVSVALVDANIGQPDVAKMTGTWGRSSGIAALTGEQRFSDEDLFDASLHVEGLGLVLGGPAKPMDEPPESMLAALTLATERLAVHHEFVIVDTPVGTVYEPIFGRFVLHVADILLMVTNPHQPTVHDTVLWVDAVSKPPEEGGFGWPRDKTVGVLNRSDPETDLTLDIVQTWAPNLDILCDIPEVRGVIAAVNNGEWRCPQVARESIANLAQQLCQAHPSITDPRSLTAPDTPNKAPGKTKRSMLSGLLKRLRGR